MRRCWIISCGTELTLGETVETNAAWLARNLAGLGLRADRLVTVPDAVEAIRDVLRQAARACDLVLMTGGLGPTDDDLTRQALAEAAGVPLEVDAPSLEQLRCFFAERNREMPDRNKVQAMIPRTGRALPNAHGTAPGIVIEVEGTPCYALPGVPFEMKAMFAQEVAPPLQAEAEGRVLLTRYLHCFGRAEASIGEEIRDLMAAGRNPSVGTSADAGVIGIRMTAAADTRAAAESMLDDVERDVRGRLGEIVFGRGAETLPSVVGDLLAAASRTVSTAESCTGGLIGELLTDVAGSSRYYVGGVVAYADEVKQRLLGVPGALLEEHGAVSEPVAMAMALGARTRLSSDYALSVTGIAGPEGGSPEKPVGLVYIGLASPAGVSVEECRFGRDTVRQVVRARTAWTALNLLRLELLGAAERR